MVLERGHDRDRRALVELGDVVHAVGLGAVAAHVVDDAARRDDHPVATLLDALHASHDPVFGHRHAVDRCFDDLPGAAHVDPVGDDRLGAVGEDRVGPLVAVAARGCLRDGDVVGVHASAGSCSSIRLPDGSVRNA